MDDLLALVHGTLFFSLVFACAVTDVAKGKIYNVPVVIGLLGGFACAYLRGGLGGIWGSPEAPISLMSSLAGFLIGGGVFYFAYLIKGLGAGDVKLMAAIGALAGLRFTAWAALATSVVGFVLAIALLVLKGEVRNSAARGLRGLFRLKYDRGDAPPTDESDSANQHEASAEAPKMKLSLPYAIAILGGVIWTTWMFMDKGARLPFQ